MKINAQIYSEKLTALQGKGIGEHGTFWKLKPNQSGFADVSYQNGPDLTHKPSSAKKILNPIEYATQKAAYNMEKALTSRDQIFAELAKPTPSMFKVMNHVNAISKSGVPLNRISWHVTPSSGSGTGAQGLRQDPMAMVEPAHRGALAMLTKLADGKVLQSEDNPSFKFRPDDLKKVLVALQEGLAETLTSNPPANTSSNSSANTSANAVGGNSAPTRSRGLGTTVAPQLLPQAATVATGQPLPQGAPGAPGVQSAQSAQSAQSGTGTPYIRQRLELQVIANRLEQVILAHEINPTQVPASEVKMAKLKLEGVNIELKMLDLAEADTAATTARPVNTTKTTTTTSSTATAPANTGPASTAKATEKLTTVADLADSDDDSSS